MYTLWLNVAVFSTKNYTQRLLLNSSLFQIRKHTGLLILITEVSQLCCSVTSRWFSHSVYTVNSHLQRNIVFRSCLSQELPLYLYSYHQFLPSEVCKHMAFCCKMITANYKDNFSEEPSALPIPFHSSWCYSWFIRSVELNTIRFKQKTTCFLSHILKEFSGKWLKKLCLFC